MAVWASRQVEPHAKGHRPADIVGSVVASMLVALFWLPVIVLEPFGLPRETELLDRWEADRERERRDPAKAAAIEDGTIENRAVRAPRPPISSAGD